MADIFTSSTLERLLSMKGYQQLNGYDIKLYLLLERITFSKRVNSVGGGELALTLEITILIFFMMSSLVCDLA